MLGHSVSRQCSLEVRHRIPNCPQVEVVGVQYRLSVLSSIGAQDAMQYPGILVSRVVARFRGSLIGVGASGCHEVSEKHSEWYG